MSKMLELLRDDSDIGQYTNEIWEAYCDDIEEMKNTTVNSLRKLGDCLLERDRLESAYKEMTEVLKGLIEDIETPHRLGLAGKPLNPNWKNLNKSRTYLSSTKHKEIIERIL